jgi:hypothetical protein
MPESDVPEPEAPEKIMPEYNNEMPEFGSQYM